jgi:hypothetical protein
MSTSEVVDTISVLRFSLNLKVIKKVNKKVNACLFTLHSFNIFSCLKKLYKGVKKYNKTVILPAMKNRCV